MKNFALLFRNSNFDYSKTSPEEMQRLSRKWAEWANGISAQGKLTDNGMRLGAEGKVLRAGGVVTDGPFVELREILGGFVVIGANSLEEATTLAHGCPVIDAGGCVEIRPLFE
jgi:hypothetical protein